MVIKICQSESDDDHATFVTGFAIKVDKYGLVLMTSAHCFKSYKKIKVRRAEDEDFLLEAEILYMKTTWEIALLTVKDLKDGIYAEFVEDGCISNCQTLVQVGHSHDCVWSIFVGRAAYQCVNNCVEFNCREICAKYVPSSLKTTPDYRIIGHMWNREYFARSKLKKFTFEKNLQPTIPIIQCVRFLGRDSCSGGPVFNVEGQIVGMLIGEADNCQIAIHVNLLKEFIKLAQDYFDEKGEQSASVGSSEVKDKKTLKQLKRKDLSH